MLLLLMCMSFSCYGLKECVGQLKDAYPSISVQSAEQSKTRFLRIYHDEAWRFIFCDDDIVCLVNGKGDKYAIHSKRIHVIYALNKYRYQLLWKKFLPNVISEVMYEASLDELNIMILKLALDIIANQNITDDKKKLQIYNHLIISIIKYKRNV